MLVVTLPAYMIAQTSALMPAMIVNNDTFPTFQLPEVVVVSKRTFANALEQARFNNLKRNVMIVYPYAQRAGTIFNEINIEIKSMDHKRDRKRYIKQKETELDDLYEKDLKDLTVSQGQILTKLVARQTGISVYNLIKEYKNPISAFYWNKMSQFFGYSLRDVYDPQENRDLELIVESLEGNY